MDPQPPPPRPDSPPRRLRACAPCTRAKARCNFREENARRHLCDRASRNTRKVPGSLDTLSRDLRLNSLNLLASLSPRLKLTLPPSTPNPKTPTRPRNPKPPLLLPLLFFLPLLLILDRNNIDDDKTTPGPDLVPSIQRPRRLPRKLCAQLPLHPGRRALGRPGLRVPAAARAREAVPVPRGHARRRAGGEDEGRGDAPRVVGRDGGADDARGGRRAGFVAGNAGHHIVVSNGPVTFSPTYITFLAGVYWAECRYWFDKQITRLVYTALGYAHSLGITKPPRSLLQPSPCRPGGSQQQQQHSYPHPYQQQWQQQHRQQQEPEDCFTNKAALSATEHHTLEEQRTFLGLFCVVSSNCAQFARKQNPLLHCLGSNGPGSGSFSSSSQGQQQRTGLGYLDICYENLAASGSLEDRMAARMFKMAAVSARLTDGFGPVMDCERGMGRGMGEGFEEEVGRLRAQVDDVLEGLDPRDPYYAYLNLQHKALLVQLYEPATKHPFPSSSSSPYPAAFQNTTTATTLNRTTYFQAALSEAKAYFAATLALPPEAYVYRTSVGMGLAQGVLAVTTRLLILHGVPGWDLPRARADVKFAEICENLVAFLGRVLQVGRERMGRLKEETWVRGVGGGGSSCGRAYNTLEFDWDDINGGSEIDARGSMCEDLIGKMSWIKGWYESRVRAEDGGLTTATTPATAGGGVGNAEAANKELMEEIARIWHWPADAAIFDETRCPFTIPSSKK
ncbi:hypothetical protein CPAR01_03596 [Colletotrichum paranaense]|uniref:Zn(2)-C6 fungal-type domain-containing protein n=1 Tax=Colletotrichum paranaense TaxID=1914294 RepID=A0ABQ9STZ4_9PEZI|nr:uncharacterized protein CPAR01_03596 [Colletotrichum paranaense]KAK1542963.1 hypothetical protein CPAR01_03596 [Colletotrichum paranaense]